MKLLAFLLLSNFLFFSCTKKEETVSVEQFDGTATHEWFFFTENGFEKTTLPEISGISFLKPWTETLRCSDASSLQTGEGALLVNRLGIIHFTQNEEAQLVHDYNLFSSTTAGNLVCSDGELFFTLLRSSFFNENANIELNSLPEDKERPFLVRFSAESGMLLPVVTYGDLELEDGGEISGCFFDGKEWLCSIKTMVNEKTFFSYIKWKANSSMAALSPRTTQGKITIFNSTKEEFRNAQTPESFTRAPDRLKSLLSSIPADFGFSVSLKRTDGTSPKVYTSNTETNSSAYAVSSPDWICAVFADGTTYFNGALSGREILNNGKNTAFRLPKLPPSYVYGPFCIYVTETGTKMSIAWEETDFYKTGRSGFLTVDLEEVLYGIK